MNPAISIVTPSFRQLNWLRLAVASVADQSGVEVEHIVQDAGSEGIEECIRLLRCSRLKLQIEEDAGMYDAINRGLSKAAGEICGWLNCDEQYLPGTLAHVANFFAASPEIDILFGHALVTDSRGKALAYRQAILPSPSHIRLSHLNTFSCATFFRKRIWENYHLPSEWKSIGDAVWMHDLLKAGARAEVMPKLLSIFSLTGANLSTDNPVSVAEKKRWLAREDAPAQSCPAMHVALHRLKKFLAGAYRKRNVAYQIYLLSSPERRVPFSIRNVGGAWKTQETMERTSAL